MVSAGDILWGRDVREFTPARHIFTGVIGGSPCQDFSKARRSPPTGQGVQLVKEFARVVEQSAPEWFLLENVPGGPDCDVPGYFVQRLNLNASECGVAQNRLRCFQFGSRDGVGLVIARSDKPETVGPCVMASEGKRGARRTWPDFCALQGLPRDFTLPGLSQAMRYKLVGNGVPVAMAKTVAMAIVRRHDTRDLKVCVCDCGRPLKNNETMATPACRKRMQRKRDAEIVTKPGTVTPAMSLTP